MRLALHILGTEILAFEVGHHAEDDDEPGDCTTYPIGFVQSYGDQRWEAAPGDLCGDDE